MPSLQEEAGLRAAVNKVLQGDLGRTFCLCHRSARQEACIPGIPQHRLGDKEMPAGGPHEGV